MHVSSAQPHLPDHGVYRNGHGLIHEKNLDETLKPVLA